jgi:hypothetical protein
MEEYQITPEPQTRPVFLTVLCILTFISTGFGMLGSFAIPAMADFILELVKQSPKYDASLYADLFILWGAGWTFYLVVFLFTAMSFTGAILMWNLRRIGFHFYAIANIILFYLPVIWLNLPFNIVGALLSAAFIGMYALHLKYMH